MKGASASPTLPAQRSGFSLILSLVVMSMLNLMLLSLSAVISIESQAARQHQLATRAKLNATAALRLALAHLQQEAGPDRRATARADFTVTQTQPGRNWTQVINPMWTGVWRNDAAVTPPAWLVSGRHDRPAGTQSTSLQSNFNPFVAATASNPLPKYPEDMWLPWQTDYVPPPGLVVPLVGPATALGAEDAVPNILNAAPATPGRPDGKVSLPKVAFADGGGSYAYWVGDEGVKARLDLSDPRLEGATDELTRRFAVRAVGRTGLEMLTGLSDATNLMDERLENLSEFALTPPTGHTASTATTLAQRLWPMATLRSRGIFADSMWGGLKVDLSSAFELDDAGFRATEFGTGPGPATFVWSPWGAGYSRRTTAAFADNKTLIRFREPGYPDDHRLAPIYAFPDASRPGSNIRGPLWEGLRGHHLLYRELEWRPTGSPTLRARTHFPNTVSLAGQVNASTAHYGHLYNRMDTNEDMWAYDTIRGTPAPLPTKPGVSPYVARQLLVFGLVDSGGEIRLVLSPVTVLHNPYNIALRISPMQNGDAAMRLSFRFWDQWRLDLSSTAGGGTNWSTDLLTMASRIGGNPNNLESMRVYVPEMTLAPGEFKILSLPGPQPLPFSRIGTSVPRFDFLGGFWASCLAADGNPLTRNATDTLRIGLRSQGPFYVRHMMSCWPGDRLSELNSSSDAALYNASSEVTELLSNTLARERSGEAPPKMIPPSAVLPAPGQTPLVLAVMDYGMRWAQDARPFPVFSRSNPLAPMTRPEATGWSPDGAPAGHATTSNSFRMTIRGANDWTEVMETDLTGGLAFGGMTQNSSGQTHAVFTEVPLTAPLSLAEYAHANIHMRDQDPLLAIGNSFASPYIFRADAWAFRPSQNCTDVDRSFMINQALFDRYFLSGAGPEWNRGAQVRDMNTVLDDFAAGNDRLGNPRIALLDSVTPEITRRNLGSHRTLAAAVMNEGAFNVNSVSVDAWAALLGATKGIPSGAAAGDAPSASSNARYPRANRIDEASPARRAGYETSQAWNGLSTLDDTQIRTLAKTIVDEIRSRSTNLHRNQEGRINLSVAHSIPTFRGAVSSSTTTVPVPFAGLAQFVNRFTCGNPDYAAHAGCLQNAIYRADTEGAELVGRSGLVASLSTETQQVPNQGPGQTPWFDGGLRSSLRAGDPRNYSVGRTRMTEGSSGSMLQSDLLAAIGPALTTRSDTFVIRVYAEAEEAGATAGTWLEAVVQRLPEFCDPTQPPETAVTHPADASRTNPALTATNRMLGRRFRAVSIRSLRLDQL